MKKFTLFLLLAAASSPAFCADPGFYSGMSLGHASVKDPLADPLTKSSDNVFGGFLGYRLNDNVAIEGGYTGIGRYRSATQGGKADALSLAAVGFVPVGDHFSLFGKVGFADALGKSSTGGLANANKIGPMFGVGLQYGLSDRLAVRLGVDRYEAAVKVAGVKSNYHSNVTGLSLVFQF